MQYPRRSSPLSLESVHSRRPGWAIRVEVAFIPSTDLFEVGVDHDGVEVVRPVESERQLHVDGLGTHPAGVRDGASIPPLGSKSESMAQQRIPAEINSGKA